MPKGDGEADNAECLERKVLFHTKINLRLHVGEWPEDWFACPEGEVWPVFAKDGPRIGRFKGTAPGWCDGCGQRHDGTAAPGHAGRTLGRRRCLPRFRLVELAVILFFTRSQALRMGPRQELLRIRGHEVKRSFLQGSRYVTVACCHTYDDPTVRDPSSAGTRPWPP